MISFFKKNRTLFSSLIAGLLVASFVLAPVAYSPQDKGGEEFKVQTAYADWADMSNQIIDHVIGIYNGVTATVAKGYGYLTAASTEAQKNKDLVQDGIVWALINMTIQQMIKSVTRWVASGFNGSPAFVTNLKGFLMKIGDQVAGQYIAKNIPLICSPFQLNIKIALMTQYKQTTRPQVACTLTGSMQNIKAFTNGSFQAGGWAQWFNVALVPNNNPYSAALNAQLDMRASIKNAQGQEMNLLKFGQGFFSKKKNGEVVNPGKVIETQLNNTFDIVNKRIAVADEMNELIATLFSTLVSKMLSSADGIASVSDSTSGGSAYWSSVDAQTSAMGAQNSAGLFTGGKEYVTKNNGYQATIVSLITGASTYMSTAHPTCSSTAGTLTSSLQTQLTNAQSKTTANNAIILKLDEYENDFKALGSGNTTLISKYPTASSAIEAQGNLMKAYESYKSSVGLPDAFLNENAQYENTSKYTPMGNLNDEITAFKTAVDAACQ